MRYIRGGRSFGRKRLWRMRGGGDPPADAASPEPMSDGGGDPKAGSRAAPDAVSRPTHSWLQQEGVGGCRTKRLRDALSPPRHRSAAQADADDATAGATAARAPAWRDALAGPLGPGRTGQPADRARGGGGVVRTAGAGVSLGPQPGQRTAGDRPHPRPPEPAAEQAATVAQRSRDNPAGGARTRDGASGGAAVRGDGTARALRLGGPAGEQAQDAAQGRTGLATRRGRG